MGENDWFSVVKINPIWDDRVSLNRITYFIWNSMQENTSKLDNFYRNNYYTFDEIIRGFEGFERLLEDNKDEVFNNPNSKLGFSIQDPLDPKFKQTFSVEIVANSGRFIIDKLEFFHSLVRDYLQIIFDNTGRKIGLDNITSKEFNKEIKSAGIDNINGITMILKKEIKFITNILSKRHPKVIQRRGYLNDSDAVMFFYLQHFKKWLYEENK